MYKYNSFFVVFYTDIVQLFFSWPSAHVLLGSVGYLMFLFHLHNLGVRSLGLHHDVMGVSAMKVQRYNLTMSERKY